ncbi:MULTISPECIES: sensor histidine kinase [Vibrio]|uniref:histidine kinase n=2 Tax=Vibrio TaxID=662 RepID=A0A7X4RV32_9VIBR|nr:ATP-binding protein [Vibrio nitrifigilis]MBF9003036.1 GHKL domain-containing protein [Vibrio nitrifigilis]MZI94521.1 GHKL domain-containing protein [Vibrio eleionomae]
MINFLLISNQNDLSALNKFSPTVEVRTQKIKKWIRDNAHGLIMIDFATCGFTLASDLIRYTRMTLRNPRLSLWLICDECDNYHVDDDLLWPDRIVRVSELEHPALLAAITNELNKQFASQQMLQEQQLNVELISKVNQFNRRDLVVQASLTEFVSALDVFCQSTQTIIVKPSKSQLTPKLFQLDASRKLISLPTIPKNLTSLMDKIAHNDLPNILFPEQTRTQTTLVFPIMIFGERFCTVLCCVESDKADHLSVSKVKIIEEAAVQLRISLESLEAQRRMKFHYSRLKKTLTELHQTKSHLVHSEKMATVGRLAAGIAHEINNPLSIALGNFTPLNHYVDSMMTLINMHDELIENIHLQDNQSASEQLSKYKTDTNFDFIRDDLSAVIEDSKESLVRVRNIVADLRSFTNQNPTEIEQFSLFNACQDVLKLHSYSDHKQISFHNHIPNELQISTNRNQLLQAINHVLENAIEALEKTENPSIKLSANSDREKIVLTISDNGIGMSEEVVSHIFDPFYSTKSLTEGRGMGLSITYHLLTQLKADIKVVSQPNEGTNVVITFNVNSM